MVVVVVASRKLVMRSGSPESKNQLTDKMMLEVVVVVVVGVVVLVAVVMVVAVAVVGVVDAFGSG